jgi:hypothetical protein
MKLLALLVVIHSMALADGGQLQWRREAGDLLVTLFAGPGDLSVLLQNHEDLAPVLDAEVSIAFSSGPKFRLTHEQAMNRLLYASSAALPEPGAWPVTISIVRNGRRLETSGILDVMPMGPGHMNYLGYFAFPPAMIGAYALRERLINRKKRG